MPCLAILLAVFFPRLVMLIIFFCTSWFSIAFKTMLWPLLGFIFMPYTTLAYMTAILRTGHHGLPGGWLALIVVAVLIDLTGHRHLSRRRTWQRTL